MFAIAARIVCRKAATGLCGYSLEALSTIPQKSCSKALTSGELRATCWEWYGCDNSWPAILDWCVLYTIKQNGVPHATAVTHRFTIVSYTSDYVVALALREEIWKHHIAFITCNTQNHHRAWKFCVLDGKNFLGTLTQPLINSLVHLILDKGFFIWEEPQHSCPSPACFSLP